MASLISGAFNSAALTGAGLIPVFVVGLAYLRYSMYDPESRVLDVQEVRDDRLVTGGPRTAVEVGRSCGSVERRRFFVANVDDELIEIGFPLYLVVFPTKKALLYFNYWVTSVVALVSSRLTFLDLRM